MATTAPAFTERQRAALPGSPFDRRIHLLKQAFPAAAAAVLVIIIGMTLSQGSELSFMVSRDKVQPATERIRSEDSTYRGLDEQGRPFTVRAGSAVQRSAAEAAVELTNLSATMTLDGGQATVTAPSGVLGINSDTLVVNGPVDARKAGFTVSGGQVAVNLRQGTAASDRAVRGRIPLGDFAANGLRSDINHETVVLTGGVRLQIPRGMGS